MTQALLGKGVTAQRCHVRLGPVPGLAQGTSPGCWSQLSPPHPAPLSLTPSIPQVEGCNHTAGAALEDARGERGESQGGGSWAEEGGMVSTPGGVRRAGVLDQDSWS